MIDLQEKDIEIERLQTTCFTLNNKVSVTDDLHQEIEMLTRRLEDSEKVRAVQKEEIAEYERNRQEYERTRLQQKRENQVLLSENESLQRDLRGQQGQKSKLQ